MSEGMTRRGRVLRDLRVAGWQGFCARRWYIEDRPNDRNAPSEINGVAGFVIRSAPCREDDHPADKHYQRHFLDVDPEVKRQQMRLSA